MPAKLDLRIGDTLALRALFTDGATNDPQPMTEWEATAMISNGCHDVDLQIVWIDREAGQATLLLADTSALNVGTYELRIRTLSPDGYTISSPPMPIVVTE